MIVAVDGPAGAGKSTLARGLAARLGLAHLDTGLLYRAVAARLLARGADPEDAAAAEEEARALESELEPGALDAPGLRGEAVGAAASRVAAHPAVRRALLAWQRRFARDPPGGAGAVLDGRDIGTVVLPGAAVKIFLTAAPAARAARRRDELRARGGGVTMAAVLRDLTERDERDRARAAAPLKPAPDALLLDTTNLDAQAALAAAVEYAMARRRPRRQGANERMSEIPATGRPEAAPDENFAALFEESVRRTDKLEGSVVEGRVIAVDNDMAVIDVGLKAEGRVPLKEFAAAGESPSLSVGDSVEVFLERIENRRGEAVLSRERARREEAWVVLEKAFGSEERVEGTIFGRVKGGFTVDLGGAVAFLPGSQVDVRPVRDITPLLNTRQPFQILKMDRRRGNIVVSRRVVMEETRAEARAELIASLSEGQVLEGVVKNITDYGAFVDLGEVDGLLHVTDMAWRRVNHPSEVLSIGQTVKVQVIRFNVETQRISLGMKQLEADPWDGVELKYPARAKFRGRVTNITDYGAFVELEPGVEGLVHVSEMSWTKKNVHPGKIVSTSQEVEVMVLDVDPHKRRVSLGLKQCIVNPWEAFAENYSAGAEVEGDVRNIAEFGLFVGLEGGIDGLVHLTDLDWRLPGEEAIKKYRKGQRIQAKVLDIDIEKERIGLGVKQLGSDPFASATAGVRRGARVTGVVSAVTEGGVEVTVNDGATGFIRRAELARDRADQRPDRYAVGDKVDARIVQIDNAGRKLGLSVKALEIAEEKQAMAEYGSSDSGASLGDILGAAIKAKAEADDARAAGSPEDAKAPEEAQAAPPEEAKTEPPDDAKTDAPEEAPAEPSEDAQAAPPEEAKTEPPDDAGAKPPEEAKTDPSEAAPSGDSEDAGAADRSAPPGAGGPA